MKSGNPNLRPKMVLLASKTLLSLLGIVEKNKIFDFECYDLTNYKSYVAKILWASTCTS
jgi:hypothetical protein